MRRALQERHRQFFFDMEPTQAFVVPSKQKSNMAGTGHFVGPSRARGYDNKGVEGVTFS